MAISEECSLSTDYFLRLVGESTNLIYIIQRESAFMGCDSLGYKRFGQSNCALRDRQHDLTSLNSSTALQFIRLLTLF
jgi:hypothetical protein